MTATELADLLRAFFGEHGTLSLATVDRHGRPHAANVYFVADDDLRLYFLSRPESDHSIHVAERSLVAGTIDAAAAPDRIHGVQLRGRCAPCTADRFDIHWAQFVQRFPWAERHAEEARSQSFYRVDPTWLRWIDNRVRFGFKVETEWPPV